MEAMVSGYARAARAADDALAAPPAEKFSYTAVFVGLWPTNP
jgi:hypothetical protein